MISLTQTELMEMPAMVKHRCNHEFTDTDWDNEMLVMAKYHCNHDITDTDKDDGNAG